MARQKVTMITCDACGNPVPEDSERINFPVLFTTSQEDGRVVEPYIENCKLDLCYKCKYNVIKIKATGCMGNNEYSMIGEGD